MAFGTGGLFHLLIFLVFALEYCRTSVSVPLYCIRSTRHLYYEIDISFYFVKMSSLRYNELIIVFNCVTEELAKLVLTRVICSLGCHWDCFAFGV